jgi:hypothetical protein
VYASEGLVAHLQGNGESTNERITESLLMGDQGDGTYVVSMGVRSTLGSDPWASVMSYEIITTSDNDLEIAQTNFLKIHD